MPSVVSRQDKVPMLPTIPTPERKKKKKKKKMLVKPGKLVKTKHFNATVEKQFLFKDFSQKFSQWKTWQKKIFLCKCTTESSLNLLLSLATAMEPVYHRDFQVISIGGFKSSLIRNFTALSGELEDGNKEECLSNEWHLPTLQANQSMNKIAVNNTKRTQSLQNPFKMINLQIHPERFSTNHTHSRERRPDSLSTIDFVHDYQRNHFKVLGSLVKDSERKSKPALLAEYKHKSWWTLSELNLETVSKTTLLQSFKEISDQCLAHFFKWTNAEKGDFYLNIFEFCSPEELIFLANCIQQRLRDINDINRLSDKLMLNIFSFLDVDSLLKCSQVCKRWSLLANHNTLWKQRAYRLADMYKQHAILNYLETIAVDLLWSDIYKELNECVQQLVIENCSTEFSGMSDEDHTERIDEIDFYEDDVSVEESVNESTLESSVGMSEIVHMTPARSFTPVSNQVLFPKTSNEEVKDDTLSKATTEEVEKVQNVDTVAEPTSDVAFDVRPKLVQPSNELEESDDQPQMKPGDNDFARVPITGIKNLKRVRKLQGHLEGILTLQFDKKRVISGSADRTIRLWDIRSGRNFYKLRGHQGGVRCLQFDNKYIATGSWDTTVMIWHVVRFTVLHTISEHKGCVSCLEMTKDFLITGSHDTTVCVFEKDTWNLVHKLNGHKGPISCMALVSDNEMLTGSHDMTVVLWDFYEGTMKKRFELKRSPILCVKVCGELIAAGTLNGSLIFWNKTNQTMEGIIKAHDGAVNAICFVGPRFITGGSDMLVKEWDLATCTCLRSLSGHTRPVLCVRASPKRIVTGSSDGTVRIWDMVCNLQQVGGPYDEMNKTIIPSEVINEKEWKKRKQKHLLK